jgi:CheY-like chemotaxis protein
MDKLLRILIVDDNENDLELTLDAFNEHKLANNIDVAVDGEEALDYLNKRGKFSGRTSSNPILIILDLKLPKIGGIEVLREIKSTKETKFIPVVVLTSSREETDIIKSYSYGVNAYVVKPVEFEDFVNAVGHLGMFWALINEPPK